MKASEFSRFKSSILPQKIKKVEILDSIKEKDGSPFRNEILMLDSALVNSSPAFVVSAISWGFDDVDEQYYAFEKLEDAQNCYNFFDKFNINDLPASRIAIVEREGKVIKRIPADSFRGYLVQEYYDGDYLRPFFDGKRLEENGEKEAIKSYIEELKKEEDDDIRKIIGTKWEKYLLKIGEGDGIHIYFENEEEDTTVRALNHYCWETGLNYLQLISRLPSNVFAEIKPFLSYHAEEIEEEGDWKGWNIDDQNKVTEILSSHGYTLNIYKS